MRGLLIFITLWAFYWTASLEAQSLSGLARFEPEGSQIARAGRGLELTLELSQPVPYRVYTLEAPERLVIDFQEVDWRGANPDAFEGAELVRALRFGGFRPGWSRMVVELGAALGLKSAQMHRDELDGSARLHIALSAVSAEEFADRAGPPLGDIWPEPSLPAFNKKEGNILVVLDPGHGGIDPGALRAGRSEKELMLAFARELADELRRLENVEVLLTREEDVFVSLERRVQIAHQAEADLFVSLHADALSEGRARGATVHTLADEASDRASALLVERHDRADMLAGSDLRGQDDEVTSILLDIARRETQPRSERLAKAIVLGLETQGAPLNRRPYRSAAFSVLKAADIPSVLLEIGFLSSERDFKNIINDEWRRQMARGIRDGIQAWIIADEALRRVVRQ